jgi:hypothetical protein
LAGRDWEVSGSRPTWAKVNGTLTQPISWAWWGMPVIPAMKEALIGGSQSRPMWAKNARLSKK